MNKSDMIHWDVLADQYMAGVRKNPVIQSLVAQQVEGAFSGAPIRVRHYNDVVVLLSSECLRRSFDFPVRILDVGAYLNLFSDFINNFNTDISSKFASTGVEISRQMCEISNSLFENNSLIEGDVKDIDTLTDREFDVIVLNNFIQLETPFPEARIKEIFAALDRVLAPGGLIFYKYDNLRIKNNDEMIAVSAEGKVLTGKDFLPGAYIYSNERYKHFWYIIKKRKNLLKLT